MSDLRKTLSLRQRWTLALLFAVPLAFMVAKWPALPTSAFLREHFSLLHLPAEMQRTVGHVLFMPLGAILVVFFRLTLGLRVLGPFRSILLALAFQTTGIVLGLVFLAITIGIIVMIRPLVKALRLPYFGRISVVLSAVALLMVTGIIAGTWLHLDPLRNVAYFPVVVLCLIGDAFATIVAKEGRRSAVWRATMTGLVAVLLTLLSAIPQLKHVLLCFPELLSAQVGCVVLIAKFLAWRRLQWLNPKVEIKGKKASASTEGAARGTVRALVGAGSVNGCSSGKGTPQGKDNLEPRTDR
jgi:hypothetical protein